MKRKTPGRNERLREEAHSAAYGAWTKQTSNAERRTSNVELRGARQPWRTTSRRESLKDFIHKLRICLKEIREAQRWLRLIHKVPLLAPAKVQPLLAETDALIRIFVASLRTAAKNR